jgi:hypothetical protein
MSVAGRFRIIGVIGGIGLGFYGFREMRLAQAAKPEPQKITCQALSEKGPGDNAHVIMTDAFLVTGSFAIQTKEKTQNASSWEKAWIPAVPMDSDYAKRWEAAEIGESVAPPTTFRVLVQTGKGNDAAMERLVEQHVIEGTVINEIDSIDKGIEKLLRDSYPGVDVDRCWILEMGRKPMGSGPALGFLAGGAALIALSIWTWIRSRRKRKAADRAPTPEPAPARA